MVFGTLFLWLVFMFFGYQTGRTVEQSYGTRTRREVNRPCDDARGGGACEAHGFYGWLSCSSVIKLDGQ
jgi:hypothetical protein